MYLAIVQYGLGYGNDYSLEYTCNVCEVVFFNSLDGSTCGKSRGQIC